METLTARKKSPPPLFPISITSIGRRRRRAPEPKKFLDIKLPRLTKIPITLAEANQFVATSHRHHNPVVGHKFSIGATYDDRIVGVVIVGRPVSRHRDDGATLEVTRLCTDGTRNACSFLYGAAARATFALGYTRVGTYILATETGASLRAAGWRLIGETPGRSWSAPSRPRIDTHPLEPRFLFEFSATRHRATEKVPTN